jgi:hypothetical protein
MAKRTKRGVSLRPIITQIHRVERAAEKAKAKATPVQARRLNAKLRKLDKIESVLKLICRGFYL